MVTHMQVQNTGREEALQDHQVEDMEELEGEEVVSENYYKFFFFPNLLLSKLVLFLQNLP